MGDNNGSPVPSFTIKDFGATDYYSLKVSPTDFTELNALSANLSILGDFTLTYGVFSNSGYTMNVAGTGTFS